MGIFYFFYSFILLRYCLPDFFIKNGNINIIKMRLYLLVVFYLFILYIFPQHKLISLDENYYIDLFQYGTDSDIIETFSRIHDDLGDDVNRKVLAVFKENHSVKVYTIIVRYIGIVKLEGADNILLQELQRESRNDDYREELVSTIGQLKITDSLRPLFDIYEEKRTSKRIKRAIIETCGKIGDRSIEDIIIAIIKDENEDIDLRARAVLTLGEIGGKESEDLLKEILLNKYEEKILRMYAVSSLSKIGKVSALETLADVINDDTHEVAEYAVNGIAEIGSERGGDILIKALRSDYDKVRYYAVIGLSKIKYKKAVDILQFKAEHDSNESIRREAKKAIENIQN